MDVESFPDALWAYQAFVEAGRSYTHSEFLHALRRVQRGIPAEHEFAALARWGGATVALPLGQGAGTSASSLQIPDLLIVARNTPFFVEVKSTQRKLLRLTESYVAKLLQFEEATRTPVLLALRTRVGIWVLREVSTLQRARTAYSIGLRDLPESLMGVLLKDRSLDLLPGAGVEFELRRKDGLAGDTVGEATVVVTDVQLVGGLRSSALSPWLVAALDAVQDSDDEPRFDGASIRQSFRIPSAQDENGSRVTPGLFAHQLMATRISEGFDEGPFTWAKVRLRIDEFESVDVVVSELLRAGLATRAYRPFPGSATHNFESLIAEIHSH